MTPHGLIENYQESYELFRHVRGTAAGDTNRLYDLLATLCSDRGALQLAEVSPTVADTTVLNDIDWPDLHHVLDTVDIDRLADRLQRFVQLSDTHGGDVFLVESQAEQDVLVEEGEALLADRHTISCLLEGIRVWLTQQTDWHARLQPGLTDCRQKLAALDTVWQAELRHFLPFNQYRQSYRELYAHIPSLWWWHRLSDCDLGLVYRVAEEQAEPSGHLQTCATCQELLRGLRETETALTQATEMTFTHPTVEDLARLYYGETIGQEETSLEAHLSLCGQCRQDLEALRRGDEVDDQVELLGAGPVVRTLVLPETLPGVAARTIDRDISGFPGSALYQDAEFEVWVWVEQADSQVILSVHGKPIEDGKAEALMLTMRHDGDTGDQALGPLTRSTQGVEFSLGSRGALHGKQIWLSLHYQGRLIALPRLDLM